MLYYFDIRKDGHFYKDEFGIELASDAAACEEAQGLAVEIVKICGLEAGHSRISVEAHRGDGHLFCVASLDLSCRSMHRPTEAEQLGRATPPEPGMPLRSLEAGLREGAVEDEARPPPDPAP